MKILLIQSLAFLGIVFFVAACQPLDTKTNPKPEIPISKSEKCKNPRPEMCTKEYAPVCASRDTGIRCVKAPCPSSKDVTYPNACQACTDSKVYSYTRGACK